jgi:hypothetical protein
MNRRPGYSTIELLWALLLGALVAGAAFTLLQTQSRLARSASDSAETSDALRTAAQVLSAETRWLVSARDVRALSTDSLSLRAFRGTGVVCALDPAYGGVVRYQGTRDPDPSKDSVLIERGANTELSAVVLGVVLNAACGGDPAVKLAVNQRLEVGDVVLVFESGNYYLTSGALRYRIGNGGRQPVTADLFDNRRTAFNTTPGAWSAALQTLAQRGRGAASAHVRLPFLQP